MLGPFSGVHVQRDRQNVVIDMENEVEPQSSAIGRTRYLLVGGNLVKWWRQEVASLA